MNTPETIGRAFSITYREPVIMGIINCTPDSFFDGGSLFTETGALSEKLLLTRAENMINAGVRILDLGGESSRPGSAGISAEEEIRRVIPAVCLLKKKFPQIIISIDTCKAAVAETAAAEGADIINDISAFQADPRMAEVMPVIIMHMQGTPRHMQDAPVYSSVADEVYNFLTERAEFLLNAGFTGKQIIIDPGIGFGKTLEHNLALLKAIPRFLEPGFPVLIGVSMKKMVGDLTGRQVNRRLSGTLGVQLAAVLNGAHIIRVHEPEPFNDLLKCFFAARSA